MCASASLLTLCLGAYKESVHKLQQATQRKVQQRTHVQKECSVTFDMMTGTKNVPMKKKERAQRHGAMPRSFAFTRLIVRLDLVLLFVFHKWKRGESRVSANNKPSCSKAGTSLHSTPAR